MSRVHRHNTLTGHATAAAALENAATLENAAALAQEITDAALGPEDAPAPVTDAPTAAVPAHVTGTAAAAVPVQQTAGAGAATAAPAAAAWGVTGPAVGWMGGSLTQSPWRSPTKPATWTR